VARVCAGADLEHPWTRPWLAESGHRPFPRASFPVPEISSASALLANVQHDPDFDTVYRRAAMFEVFDGRVIPSLALASYLTAHPGTLLKISPGRFTVGEREIPIDGRGKAILNFRGPSGTHKAYNAASVIRSGLLLQAGEKPAIENLEDFRDAYVLFGFSAPGLYDLRPTPVSGIYPGVEISATMLDNLLAGDFIRPVPAAPVVVLTLLMALLAGVATSRARGIAKSVLVYTVVICAPFILCAVAYRMGYWLPLMVQMAAVVVTLFSAGLYYTTEGRQKMFIRAPTSNTSPAVIDRSSSTPNA
jgi:adenylate cyclase